MIEILPIAMENMNNTNSATPYGYLLNGSESATHAKAEHSAPLAAQGNFQRLCHPYQPQSKPNALQMSSSNASHDHNCGLNTPFMHQHNPESSSSPSPSPTLLQTYAGASSSQPDLSDPVYYTPHLVPSQHPQVSTSAPSMFMMNTYQGYPVIPAGSAVSSHSMPYADQFEFATSLPPATSVAAPAATHSYLSAPAPTEFDQWLTATTAATTSSLTVDASYLFFSNAPSQSSAPMSIMSSTSISSTSSLPPPPSSPLPTGLLAHPMDVQNRANSTSPSFNHNSPSYVDPSVGSIITSAPSSSAIATNSLQNDDGAFFQPPAPINAITVESSHHQHHHHHHHHQQQQRSSSPTSTSSAPAKTYACDFCDKVFHRAYNLKSHLLSHSKARPYVCRYEGCPWRFSRPHDLRRHEALHSGHRPFACSTCGKRFAREEALRRHAEGDSICLRVASMLAHAAAISDDITLTTPPPAPRPNATMANFTGATTDTSHSSTTHTPSSQSSASPSSSSSHETARPLYF